MGSGALASGMTDDAVPINCSKRHELASSNVDRKRDRYSKRKYRGQFWNRKELSFFFFVLDKCDKGQRYIWHTYQTMENTTNAQSNQVNEE